MTWLSFHYTALTRSNFAFLQGTLANLERADCVLEEGAREDCRRIVRQALQARVSTFQVADALMNALRDQLVRDLREGYENPDGTTHNFLADVKRLPLGEISNAPPAVRRFLAENPEAARLEMVELRAAGDPFSCVEVRKRGQEKVVNHWVQNIFQTNNLVYFSLTEGLGKFFFPDNYRIHRLPSLALLLGLSHLLNIGEPVIQQFTASISKLGEMKEMLEERPARRPLYLSSSPYMAHDNLMSPLKGAYHDVTHAYRWGLLTDEEREDALFLYDLLEKCYADLPSALKQRLHVDFGLDSLLGGRRDESDITTAYHGFFKMIPIYLRVSNPNELSAVSEFMGLFREQVQKEVSHHCRRERFLAGLQEATAR